MTNLAARLQDRSPLRPCGTLSYPTVSLSCPTVSLSYPTVSLGDARLHTYIQTSQPERAPASPPLHPSLTHPSLTLLMMMMYYERSASLSHALPVRHPRAQATRGDYRAVMIKVDYCHDQASVCAGQETLQAPQGHRRREKAYLASQSKIVHLGLLLRRHSCRWVLNACVYDTSYTYLYGVFLYVHVHKNLHVDMYTHIYIYSHTS